MTRELIASLPRPLDVKRSRWLHHFQVWSPKLKRRISLYSYPSVSVWALIEASPDIISYRERPGYVLINGERVLADFWVEKAEQNQYFILPGTPTLTVLDDPGGLLDPLPLFTITHDWLLARKQLIANWLRILPHVTSCMPFVSAALLDEVLTRLSQPMRLIDIERALLPEDPALTRAAVFDLLRRGHLAAEKLAAAPLTGALQIVSAR